MRLNRFFFLAVVLVTNLESVAYAAQPWDWKIGASPDGTDANLAVFFPGTQGGIEHRRSVYGANQLRLAVSSTCALPAFANAQADVDMRILFLQPGVSVGANDTWRNYTFAPDESMSRARRRERWASGEYDNVFWPYIEGRLMVALPFNDYVLLQTTGSVTHEGRPDRSYDWQNAIVHDGGLFYKWETNLFLHHKKFGGLAPKLQVIDFSLDEERHTQINYGFMMVTRAGLTRYNDVFLVQVLFTANVFGSYDNSQVYGYDQFRLPFNFLIAYQSTIPFWTKTPE